MIKVLTLTLSPQLAALLTDAPSFLHESLQSFFSPEDMKAVLDHHRNLGHFEEKGAQGSLCLQMFVVKPVTNVSKRKKILVLYQQFKVCL